MLALWAPAAALAGPFIPCGVAPRPLCIGPAPGAGIPTPAEVPGKEYSDHFDKDGIVGAPDPEQNIAWDGVVPGGVADTFDYSGSRLPPLLGPPEGEVDALANVGDALFHA